MGRGEKSNLGLVVLVALLASASVVSVVSALARYALHVEDKKFKANVILIFMH